MTSSTITYKPLPERLVRTRSAATAINAITTLDILEIHKRELLSVCIWKITEAEGKWNVRFRSEKALTNPADLRHEHVYERKHLIDRLLAGESVETVIEDAIACIVTKEEHRALSRIISSGWDRYRGAGIRVFDLQESCWVIG